MMRVNVHTKYGGDTLAVAYTELRGGYWLCGVASAEPVSSPLQAVHESCLRPASQCYGTCWSGMCPNCERKAATRPDPDFWITNPLEF